MRSVTLPDIRTEGDIKTLVDCFCQKLHDDEVLAPVFNAVARIHWPYYLTSMYQFWSSTLLKRVPVNGEAVPKNLVFPASGPHAQRWTSLFEGVVTDHFAGLKAEEAKAKMLGLTCPT